MPGDESAFLTPGLRDRERPTRGAAMTYGMPCEPAAGPEVASPCVPKSPPGASMRVLPVSCVLCSVHESQGLLMYEPLNCEP